jgi:hypothetical protein
MSIGRPSCHLSLILISPPLLLIEERNKWRMMILLLFFKRGNISVGPKTKSIGPTEYENRKTK